ncbi:hypothetical protein ACLOJK_027667 [Asimina triloba]
MALFSSSAAYAAPPCTPFSICCQLYNHEECVADVVRCCREGCTGHCLAGHDDGADAAQMSWMWINGQIASIEEDDGGGLAAIDAWICAIGIDHKNPRLMMLPPDLTMPIDAVVVADDKRDGFSGGALKCGAPAV